MKTLLGLALAVLAFPIAGQQPTAAGQRLVPLTVCGILADPQRFDGKDVAVLGRFAPTEEGWWLSEDDCGRKFITEGFTWPNAIWLDCCQQPAPDPPTGVLLLDEAVLSEKLKQMRKTTELRFETRWVGSGTVTDTAAQQSSPKRRLVRQDWAVAFGRLETRKEPRVVRGADGQLHGFGFGHLAAAPVQIVIKHKNVRTISDSEGGDLKQK